MKTSPFSSHKTVRRTVLLLGTIFAAGYIVSRIWYYVCEPPLTTRLLPCHVQTGDLIFTIGHSVKSDIVKAFEKKEISNVKYSHVGIIVVENDSISIVHMSVDDGFIKREPQSIFLQQNQVIGYDIFRLKKEFGTMNDIRLHKLLEGYLHEKKKFDYLFDMKDESLFYCTELIMHILNYMKIEHLEDIRFEKYLYPNNIINSKLFIKL